MQPELVADTTCHTGENPLWSPDERCVYWVDIPQGKLYQYLPELVNSHSLAFQAEVIGGFTLQEDGALLLFMDGGHVARLCAGILEIVIPGIPGEANSRFNDVIADPEGRVFCGTMSTPERPGRLYRLDPDGTLTVLLEGIGVSNGLGFTPDLKQLYYTDSPARKIYLFDYERSTGAISHQRVFAEFPEGGGNPDGMTVDAEGCVWTALWDGGCLARLSPAGEEMTRIRFPARKVSSVTFGGDDYQDMYVTTAGGYNRAEEGPGAGALFRVNVGIRGLPEFRSKIGG